mgnify:CR=1 FL=1
MTDYQIYLDREYITSRLEEIVDREILDVFKEFVGGDGLDILLKLFMYGFVSGTGLSKVKFQLSNQLTVARRAGERYINVLERIYGLGEEVGKTFKEKMAMSDGVYKIEPRVVTDFADIVSTLVLYFGDEHAEARFRISNTNDILFSYFKNLARKVN